MKIRKISVVLIAISATILCAGCDSMENENVPELIEPIALVSSYRPVERGQIGNAEILVGTVVPKEYGNFYETGAKVLKVTVDIGDFVKKGDVLAYADTNEIKEQIEELENEKQYKATMFQLRTNLYLENKKLIGEDAVSLAVEEENYNYDLQLYQYENEKIEQQIEERKKIERDGILVANHAGYVSYIKNIAYNDYAVALENVVVVTDENDIYIELGNKDINNYPYLEYEYKYIKNKEEIIGIKELEYTAEEQIAAGISKRYPNIRFEIPDKIHMDIGDNCPIFFVKRKPSESLIICNDSIYSEDDKNYVYVLGKDKKREKRYISIGESDRYYSQVISGLSLDEFVYYESETSIPSGNNISTATYSDFEISNYSTTFEVRDYYTKNVTSELEGVVKKVCVSPMDEIKKGTLLYVINTGTGKADLAKAGNEIKRENRNYADLIKEYNEESEAVAADDEMAVYKKNIIHINKQIAEENHKHNINFLTKEYEKISKNNDGTGKISIYADVSGTIASVEVEKNQRVLLSDMVLSIHVPAKKNILVHQKPVNDVDVISDNIADFNEDIIFANDTKEITGKCVGYTVNAVNNESKCFVNTINNKAYVSFNTSSGYDDAAFYVKLNKKGDYNRLGKSLVKFSYIRTKNVVVIPAKYVYKEQQGSRKDCAYIWKNINGQAVKQYVLIDTILSNAHDVVILSGLDAGEKYQSGD